MKNNIISAVLSVFSAILLIFSFPPFNLSFLAWLALVPLFLLLADNQLSSAREESSPRKIFIFYYSAGLVFWLCHIWWIVYVTFLGYCLLVIYLAAFLGLFGLSLEFLRKKTGYPFILIAPPLWVTFELARTYLLISFPWSLLGYSQWQNIPLIQISSITGVYGVSFLIVMINAAIADFIFAKTKKQSHALPFGHDGWVRNLALSILIVAMITAFGWTATLKENNSSDKIKISVIQGNIAQDIKWDEEYAENILNTYAELSIYASTEEGISLVVWPETSYPDYVDIDSALFKKIQTLTHYLGTPLLMGAVSQQNGRDYNSALLISPDGDIKQTYNKLHLVPFAEYLPLQKFLFFLGNSFPQIGNFSKGEDYTIFRIPKTHSPPVTLWKNVGGEIRNLKSPLRVLEENKGGQFSIPNNFAVLICFEDLFPDLARKFTNRGANFLVVITNDAHFKESPALWQHFAHSVFRAVENRRPVIRAANNGISGFINSRGIPVKILTENEKIRGARGYATNQISPSYGKTFYTRFGDLFVRINIIYLVVVLIITAKKNTKKL